MDKFLNPELYINNMKMMQLTFTFLIFLLTTQFSFSQQPVKKNLKDLSISEEPANCEMTTLNVDRLAETVKNMPNENGFVIFIARLGAEEKNRNLNQSRLSSIKKVFQTRYSEMKHQVIFTEGERTKTLGRIEFYWNGELIGEIIMNKNRGVCFSCCN